jgi:hypothetical protein
MLSEGDETYTGAPRYEGGAMRMSQSGTRRVGGGLLVMSAAFALALALAGCGSGNAPGTAGTGTSRTSVPPSTVRPTTTTSPRVTFDGRLLFLDLGNGDLYEERAGSAPARIGTLAGFHSSDATYASPDGQLFVDGTQATITELGSRTATHLPDATAGDSLNSVDFSPDGRLLAYTTSASGRVVVYDLATKSAEVVLQTPCAYYSGTDSGTTVCGSASAAVWIDASTLFAGYFSGTMPPEVGCSPGSTAGCTSPDADTYGLVTTGGVVTKVVVRGEDPRANGGAPLYRRGDTVVLEDGDWVEVAALRSGTATGRALPARVEVYSLSGDGSTVAVPGQASWQLVDIRTGATKALGAKAVPPPGGWASNWNDDPAAWSPDGRYLLVWSAEPVVVPVSGGPGGTVPFPADATLLAWLP